MFSNYDVFKITDGKPQWLSCAKTLDEARSTVNRAGGNEEFVILNQKTQEQITVKPEVKAS